MIMKPNILIVIALCITTVSLLAQESGESPEPEVDKPERDAFASPWLIDNPTGLVPQENTLVFDILHRFGVIESGKNDLLGIWGASNIRLGLSYAITDWITLGFGTTKNNRLQDFNLRLGLLRQTRMDRVPVSITFYGNTAIDARESDFFPKFSNRISYFSQLIFMRRFGPSVSFQISPSFSHYNLIDASLSNHQFAAAVGGKVNITDDIAVLVDYSQPFGQNSDNPGLALGFELSTSSHAFQVFVGNYNGLVPQKNYMLNPNKLADKEILIGFNINRLWNF